MFDANFTFTTPTSPTLTSTTSTSEDTMSRTSRSVSPCSPTSAFPPPRFSMTDLAAQFGDARIRSDSRIFTDSCAAYANMDDDADWSIPSIEEEGDEEVAEPLSRSRTFPTRAHSPSRRTQRQANSRLLCSSAHRKELVALVGRMVERKEQCSISPPETEDEGYNSASELPQSRRSSAATVRSTRPEMSYRRNSDMRTSGTCVSKDVRLRKGSERRHCRVRSSEKS